MKHIFTFIAITVTMSLFANPINSVPNQIINTDGVLYIMETISIDSDGTITGKDIQGEELKFTKDEIKSISAAGKTVQTQHQNPLSVVINADGVMYHFEKLDINEQNIVSGTDVQGEFRSFTESEVESFTIVGK
jgi:hypothetical protein